MSLKPLLRDVSLANRYLNASYDTNTVTCCYDEKAISVAVA
jgi:hypothetical protein